MDIDEVLKIYRTNTPEEIVLQDPEEQMCFYKMERAATAYAKKFFDYLCSASHDLTNASTLPIVFQSRYDAILNSKEKDAFLIGQFREGKWFEKQAVIEITLPVRKKRAYLHKSLKQYIRHETIHYYLWLRDVPYQDDTALFWAYCNIYDARAYKTLPEEEQLKYKAFCNKCAEYPNSSMIARQLLADGVILKDKRKMESFTSRYEFEITVFGIT